MENLFLNTINNESRTENGAIAYKSVGSTLVDQFGVSGSHRGRNIEDVFADQEKLFLENDKMSLIFVAYLRAITRKTKGAGIKYDEIVKGQGARDESFKRALWFAKNHYKSFINLLWLYPIIGSWKDIFTLYFYDKKYGVNAIKQDDVLELIRIGLASDVHSNLVKKFMPRIISEKKCTTEWTKFKNHFAKILASYLAISYKEYNQLKTSGDAHTFQKLISNRKFDEIEWSKIPGKAMLNLTSGKFLENQHLEDSFIEWMENQDDVKFNGYPYELYVKYRGVRNSVNEKVLDLQFNSLVKTGKACGSINGNVWCALDTSGSMTQTITFGQNLTAYDVCASLGIYFSELNEGWFHNNVVLFDSVSKPIQLCGTFTNKCEQLKRCFSMGSTNFQSIIDALVRVRIENKAIPMKDYPTTILVVSDMHFNPSYKRNGYEQSNALIAKEKLYQNFPKEYVDNLKFVWWNVIGDTGVYPTTLKDKNAYFFSGFDGAIITELLGGDVKKKESLTMPEIIEKAFSHPVFSTLEIVD